MGARPRALRALLGGRVGRHRRLLVLGHPEGGQPPVERACGSRRQARRARRAHPAAAPRDRDRLHGDFPDGGDRAAALASVRPGGSGIPARSCAGQRRHRRAHDARQSLGDQGPPDAPAACDRRGGRARGRGSFIRGFARKGERSVRYRRHCGERPGADHLHERNDRRAQRSARGAPAADRESERLRAFARLLSAAGRHLLVASGLGLGRRAVRRAAADLGVRPADPRLSREVRRREGLLPAGEIRHPQCVSLSDRPETDDEGRAGAEKAVSLELEIDHERGRSGRRDADRVGQGAARRHDQRDVRPDRDQPGEAPGGRQRGGDRQARRDARRHCQGVHRAAARAVAVAGADRRSAAARARPPCALRIPARDRVHRCAAHDHHRQGAAQGTAQARGSQAQDGVKRILLIGAGHAHAVVLRSLAENALYGARITLVAPYPRQIYSAMLPGVIAGHYAQREAIIDVARLAERAYVEFVRGAVEEFDAARRSVTLRDGKQIGFDLASLNVGSRVDSSVPGSTHHALAVKPFERFIDLLKIPDRVAIAGAGAAGAELAMALRYAGSAVTLYSEQSGFPPALEKRVTSALRRAGVDFRPGMPVTAVENGPTVIAGSARQSFDLLIWATGAAPWPWLRGSGLALDEKGFVRVKETLRSVSHPEIFAAGDCAALDPKSGVYSVRQGALLVENLRHLVRNEGLEAYQPNPRALLLLSCGARYAIAQRGEWTAQGSWVWHRKDWIDRRWVRSFTAGN